MPILPANIQQESRHYRMVLRSNRYFGTESFGKRKISALEYWAWLVPTSFIFHLIALVVFGGFGCIIVAMICTMIIAAIHDPYGALWSVAWFSFAVFAGAAAIIGAASLVVAIARSVGPRLKPLVVE